MAHSEIKENSIVEDKIIRWIKRGPITSVIVGRGWFENTNFVSWKNGIRTLLIWTESYKIASIYMKTIFFKDQAILPTKLSVF